MAKLDEVAKQLENEGKRPENTDNRNNKKTRVPFGTARGKLDVKGKAPGFHYVWVNDDKVDQRLEEGFEFVTHNVQVGTRKVAAATTNSGSMCVTIPVGAGVIGYLMRIPQEFYDEDVKNYHKNVVDATEETLRKNLVKHGLSGSLEIGKKNT